MTCEKCGKIFKGESILKVHMTKIHKNGRLDEFKCGECDKIFKSKAMRFTTKARNIGSLCVASAPKSALLRTLWKVI